MKYGPSKRVVWLVVPLLPVAVMCLGVWLAGKPDTEAIANRGAKPPVDRRLTASPSTWGPGDAEALDAGHPPLSEDKHQAGHRAEDLTP